MYIDKPLKTYLDDLAARKAAPGGGSAAALSASIGTSLMSMVLNYTIGNPKYKKSEVMLLKISSKVNEASVRLRALIDEDVEAYERLSKGFKEFKGSPARLEVLYKAALTPPLEICRICGESLRLCGKLAAHGNTNLITDTAIAAIMLEGAFFSAKFNVYVNMKYIGDMDYVGKIHKELSSREEAMPKLKVDVLEKCEEVIK